MSFFLGGKYNALKSVLISLISDTVPNGSQNIKLIFGTRRARGACTAPATG